MLPALEKNEKFTGRKGPVVLMILDGVGYGEYKDGDAVLQSSTPTLDALKRDLPDNKT